MPDPVLSNVQGNVLGGFLKDHQHFLMLSITDPVAAKSWIRQTACNQVATADEVVDFNRLFKKLRQRRGEHAIVGATWMNLAFTRRGLVALGVSATDLALLDPSFNASVVDQATNVLGDAEASAPANWHPPYRDQTVDAVIIVAADDRDALDDEVQFFTGEATSNGFGVVHAEPGEARADRRGFEHFGYKDGISQPRIANVDEGGTLSPWLFLVDASATAAPPPQPPQYPGQPQPPQPPSGPPAWAHEGSYLVFRRLRQLVPEFAEFVATECPGHLDPVRFGAKLVGRYQDGAPYEPIPAIGYDPDRGDPLPAGNRAPIDPPNVNNVAYGQDPDGRIMPLAAHIRKTNPRAGDSETHRLLRRGIAYGKSYDAAAAAGSPEARDADRGLLFVCYQASLRNQFEFVQQSWANATGFPPGHASPPGHDPIIGQDPSGKRFFGIPGPHGSQPITEIDPFVVTTGTLYCFQPSVAMLKSIGA